LKAFLVALGKAKRKKEGSDGREEGQQQQTQQICFLQNSNRSCLSLFYSFRCSFSRTQKQHFSFAFSLCAKATRSELEFKLKILLRVRGKNPNCLTY